MRRGGERREGQEEGMVENTRGLNCVCVRVCACVTGQISSNVIKTWLMDQLVYNMTNRLGKQRVITVE